MLSRAKVKESNSLTFENDKNSLIDTIVWYRDKYHKVDFGHNELIEEVRRAKNEEDLSFVEVILDGWLSE